MYDYSQDPSAYATSADAGGLFAVLAGLLLFFLVFAVVVYVLTSLGLMKFFEKAGKPGWAAWVPFYNVWVMAEVAKTEAYWFWVYVGGVVVSFVPVLGFLSIASLVAMIIITHKFLARFGKDGGGTALAVLFPYVYYPVVGFSKNLKFGSAPAVAAAPKQS